LQTKPRFSLQHKNQRCMETTMGCSCLHIFLRSKLGIRLYGSRRQHTDPLGGPPWVWIPGFGSQNFDTDTTAHSYSERVSNSKPVVATGFQPWPFFRALPGAAPICTTHHCLHLLSLLDSLSWLGIT
jgi:hypothetical protein